MTEKHGAENGPRRANMEAVAESPGSGRGRDHNHPVGDEGSYCVRCAVTGAWTAILRLQDRINLEENAPHRGDPVAEDLLLQAKQLILNVQRQLRRERRGQAHSQFEDLVSAQVRITDALRAISR